MPVCSDQHCLSCHPRCRDHARVTLLLIQQLLNGLTVGSTYALIAIGYTMVYGIIGMINFAHGEVYMIGSYIAFMAIAALALFGLEYVPLLIIGAFVVSMIVTSAYGYSIERVAYRPLRGGNRLIPLISAIGMSIFLQNLVRLAQGSRDIAMPSLVTGGVSIGPDEGFQASLVLHADDYFRGDPGNHDPAHTVHHPLTHGPRLPRLRGRPEDDQTCWASTPTASSR